MKPVIHHGDCLDIMRAMPDNSVDAIVTDPPYGLEFMDKEWDSFRVDDPGSNRHRGERAGSHGEIISQATPDDAHPARRGAAVAYGGGKRPSTNRCTGCGKRDQFRNDHDCDLHARWVKVSLDPYAAPPTMLAFGEWCRLWAIEALRVLKPGGHMLAFGGTRTWHRLACAVEDAGFEIRDSIAWMYGSGFPKSLDVSKAIDRKRDDQADVLAVTTRLADLAEAAGISRADIDAHLGTSDMGGWWLSRLTHRCACPSVENWTRLRDFIPGASDLDAEVWRLNGRKGSPGEAWERREKIGEKTSAIATPGDVDRHTVGGSRSVLVDITAPATDDARTWQGWGTALKPAFEPIVVARKPLVGTVAANVLAWGTGALNVDGCRVEHASADDLATSQAKNPGRDDTVTSGVYGAGRPQQSVNAAGRWPANVVLDESQADALDQQSGPQRGGVAVNRNKDPDAEKPHDVYGSGWLNGDLPDRTYGGEGGASRFFYVAKADASERVRIDGTAHPTVKPLALMRWLVRLVTPPGGTVLDPFAGSGTTLEAAMLEGFASVGIEREADYLPLIRQRIDRRRDPVQAVRDSGEDGGLFDLLGGEPA